MVIVLCECNWGLPDVDRLPPHQHLTRQHVIADDGRCDMWTSGGVLPGDGYRIVEEVEEVVVSVPWREFARASALAGDWFTGGEK